MVTWKSTLATAVATLMLAGSAFAQATTGSPATGAETKGEQSKDSMQKPDSAGQMPRTTDSMKSSDAMKSDTMKSSASRGRKGSMASAGDEKVKAAQQALKDKGHDPGSVDGRMGPKTQAALRDFQKAQGMQATGRLDAKTMQSLGIEGEKTSATSAPATSGSASPATDASKTDASKTDAPAAADTSKDASGGEKK